MWLLTCAPDILESPCPGRPCSGRSRAGNILRTGALGPEPRQGGAKGSWDRSTVPSRTHSRVKEKYGSPNTNTRSFSAVNLVNTLTLGKMPCSDLQWWMVLSCGEEDRYKQTASREWHSHKSWRGRRRDPPLSTRLGASSRAGGQTG